MIGKKLAHYEILSHVGSGGMGDVYRARDEKLKRDVALKILPVEMSGDPERLLRFEREARTLASLQHPNVASIYGFEQDGSTRFLVMELVEGEDLSQRLQRGPLPVDEVVEIARQLITGLEAAHDVGVVHRDLKPANVKLTPDGKAKILDFGLARSAGHEDGSDADLENSPTITAAMTQAGVILGTAAYMSPEQARGRPVDHRADIWALGVILFELLTGQRLFEGETVSDTLAAVLRKEPDFGDLPTETPATLRAVIRLSLTRKAADRLHSVTDARLILDGLGSLGGASTAAGTSSGRFRFLWPALAVLAIIAAAWGWMQRDSGGEESREITRVTVGLPEDALFRINWGIPNPLDVSADGRSLYYISRFADRYSSAVFVRHLDSEAASEFSRDPIASWIRISPDGRRLAGAEMGRIALAPASGGASARIAALNGDSGGGDWVDDDTLVFAEHLSSGLTLLDVNSGETRVLTTPDREGGEVSHRLPSAIQGTDIVLFTIKTDRLLEFSEATIAAVSMRTGTVKVILEGGSDATYIPTGHLVYYAKNGLHAVRFNVDALQVEGLPSLVQDRVAFDESSGSALYTITRSGDLYFVEGEQIRTKQEFVWVDDSGQVTEDLGTEPISELDAAVSPDGSLLCLTLPAANNKLWLLDLERKILMRLTYGAGNDADPLWSPDGKHVYFRSDRQGDKSIYRVDVRTNEESLVLQSQRFVIPSSISSDGRTMLYTVMDNSGANLEWISLEGEAEPQTFLRTQFDEDSGKFSPDGNWVAYESDESGVGELYIRRFPDAAERVQVTSGGVRTFVWRADGKGLVYESSEDRSVVSISLAFEDRVRVGRPRIMFERPQGLGLEELAHSSRGHLYSRWLTEQDLVVDGVQLVTNWFEVVEGLTQDR